MNKRIYVYIAVSAAFTILASVSVMAADQRVIDQCIAEWGKASPFKKGGGAEQGYFTRREGIRDWQE